MFGLGLGSFIGGHLSQSKISLPKLFLFIEIGIGVFGLFSLALIKWLGAMTLHLSLFKVALVIFAILAFPTMLMGATLPILVAYLNQRYNNIGKSVSWLYFFNTLGSSLASIITAEILFVIFGLKETVLVASFCNLVVGTLVYFYTVSLERTNSSAPSLRKTG
jgi:predicted membrane-bound spermidine synthase